MSTWKRPVIGVRLPPWATFAGSVFLGLLDYMRLHGWWELVTENDAFGEMEPIRLDQHWRGQGLVTFRMTKEEAAAWNRAGVAVVNISSEGVSGGYPRVIPDNAQVGALAAEHLVSLGLREFAFIGREASHYNVASWVSGPRRYARERWEGFSNALAQRGVSARSFFLPPHPLWKKTAWKAIREELAAFLKTLPTPYGVFAADDPLAVAVRQACHACDRRVPDDLPIIGFGNDTIYCHGTTPALSSVEYPGREIGFRAAHFLAEQLEGRALGEIEERIPVTTVVPRESTEFLAFDDPEILRLVRWIRLNALGDPIQVSDVQAQSTLSMTVLKERFQAALGHGPKREIMQTRLRHLEYLLRSRDLPLDQIAESMRFPSLESMSRFLFRQTGRKAEELRG
jgi:DNA-binding LacI/PurR family transcriptional regulator